MDDDLKKCGIIFEEKYNRKTWLNVIMLYFQSHLVESILYFSGTVVNIKMVPRIWYSKSRPKTKFLTLATNMKSSRIV